MATNQRTFQDGVNEMNGYVVNVVRFTSAYNTTFNDSTGKWNRQCALHWGTITTPDGDVIDMGESGMSTPQIKRIIGGETKQYNRDGNSEIKSLEKLKSQLESLGMNTAEVDAKIEAEKARIEAESNRVNNSRIIKKFEKEIKELEKTKNQLRQFGLSTTELDAKIEELQDKIEELR